VVDEITMLRSPFPTVVNISDGRVNLPTLDLCVVVIVTACFPAAFNWARIRNLALHSPCDANHAVKSMRRQILGGKAPQESYIRVDFRSAREECVLRGRQFENKL
jgi:hypothetical protein